jgi:hypothetical protein
VGRASPLLTPRSAALAALAIWLAFYYSTSSRLWQGGLWADVVFIGFVLMPSTLALIYFALPFRRWHGLAPVGLAFVVLALALRAAELLTLADFAKLAAMTAIGLWFLGYFETIGWVVLIACIVPWVDAYSVWRGPTSKIVAHHGSTFSLLSFSFPVPGEHAAAHLGLPDLLFFTLFLGASDRFGLRVRLTWLALVVSLGCTLVVAVGLDVAGLPALPFLSAGFLAANADLLWQRLRPGRERPEPVAPSP